MLQKRLVKITVYLGLEIIIKLKFTTNFDGFAIVRGPTSLASLNNLHVVLSV